MPFRNLVKRARYHPVVASSMALSPVEKVIPDKICCILKVKDSESEPTLCLPSARRGIGNMVSRSHQMETPNTFERSSGNF